VYTFLLGITPPLSWDSRWRGRSRFPKRHALTLIVQCGTSAQYASFIKCCAHHYTKPIRRASAKARRIHRAVCAILLADIASIMKKMSERQKKKARPNNNANRASGTKVIQGLKLFNVLRIDKNTYTCVLLLWWKCQTRGLKQQRKKKYDSPRHLVT
jgi:hypothetical protein